MIDLHTHTTHSDGTLQPAELVELATRLSLDAVAITDHDTFSGYDEGAPVARRLGLDLICGIEISTKYDGRSVHLLGYFLSGAPPAPFRDWILTLQASRHARNQELIRNLHEAGIRISLEDWYARGGKLPGRPHLAALLVEHGYVASVQQAFDEYLAETGRCYTSRIEPELGESIEQILQNGGIPVLPHPLRSFPDADTLERHLAPLQKLGLKGIEVIHSDHSAETRSLLHALAARLRLIPTGGSDFHGLNKPAVQLGSGKDGNVQVQSALLRQMRRYASGDQCWIEQPV